MRIVVMIGTKRRSTLLLLSLQILSAKCQLLTEGNVNQYESNLLPNASNCGYHLANKIYGGQNTEPGQYPWMALLEYRKSKGVLGAHCGGALISTRYVLTAAHCISGRGIPRTWTLYSVRLGDWNIKTDPDCTENECAPSSVRVRVERTVVHSSYQPDAQANDIALIRLSRNVEITDYIQPICLPNINPNVLKMNVTGYDMYVAGWGKTETVSQSDILQSLRISVTPSAECRTKYSSANIQVTPQQFCAGGKKGQDTCQGDSGGPLMYLHSDKTLHMANWYVLGIVNFGPSPCGLEGWPGVYTRVQSFAGWIVDNMTN